MDSATRKRLLAYMGLVLTTLFWAGNAVLARWVADEIPPFALAFYRWGAALVILLPFGLPHLWRGTEVIRSHLWQLFWLGLLSVGAYNTLLYIAAHSTTALNITLVNSTLPIAIAVLAHLLLDQRTTARQAVGFVAAGAGMVMIIARGDWRVLAGFAFREGDLLMIGAVLAWAIYSVALRRWRIELHPIGFLTMTMIVGVALLLPPFGWETAVHGHFAWRPVHLLMFGYLAIFPSILAFLFWNRAVAVVGPSITGMFIYLVPVFTAGLAHTLLGEVLQPYHAIGGFFILAGLYLAIWRSGDARAGGMTQPERPSEGTAGGPYQ